ncbi:MAG: Xaa-Pro peptidase family protein [bacterium]|nr:Xaa-Pro peptidase family protein [bacterium]
MMQMYEVSRLKKLQDILLQKGMDAILITNIINVRYLSGFTGSSGEIILTPASAYLVVDGRYFQQADDETNGFELIRCVGPLKNTLKDFFSSKYDIRRLGVEADHLSYQQYQIFTEHLEFLQLIPTTGMVIGQRCIKSPEEVQKIKIACEIASKVYNKILPMIKPGISEIDLLCELEYQTKKSNGQVAFEPIIASGVRSSLPHARASNKIIQDREPILIDWGARYEGYHCDITRVILPDGVSPEFQDMYQAVKETHSQVMRMLKPGIRFEEINEAGKNILTQFGYGDFWLHKIGHGIGLEVHEKLSNDDEVILMPGMVITIEPGAYIPQIGGARVEDTVLITDNGCEVLSKQLAVSSDHFLPNC